MPIHFIAVGGLAVAALLAAVEIGLGLMPSFEEAKALLLRNTPMKGLKDKGVHRLRDKYQQLTREKRLSPEQEQVFGELITLTSKDDVPVPAAGLTGFFLKESLEDPEAAERNLALARELLTMLKEKGVLTWGDFATFARKHPSLEGLLSGQSPQIPSHNPAP